MNSRKETSNHKDCLQELSPYVLTIGGSDPSSGAGIQQDLYAFAFSGVRGLSAISCLTVQNSKGIVRVIPVQPSDLRMQIEACLDDFPVTWAKIALLPTQESLEIVSELITTYDLCTVIDPIFQSGKGYPFANAALIRSYSEKLCPKARLITPNLLELKQLAEVALSEEIAKHSSPLVLAKALAKKFDYSVFLKGGHFQSSSSHNEEISDFLVSEDKVFSFSKQRWDYKEIHGSGCFISSVITAFCSQGLALEQAVADAEAVFHEAVKSAYTHNQTTFLNVIQAYALRYHELTTQEEVKEVVRFLERQPKSIRLIPEVRTNVSIISYRGIGLQDIAAVDGRLTVVAGKVCAPGPIAMGCTNHTGRLLLACRKLAPHLRAVINLKYSEKILNACKNAELNSFEVFRDVEPEHSKDKECSTMAWFASQINSALQEKTLTTFPDIIYDKGDIGKEPMIRLFGSSGRELIQKLTKILDLF